MKQLVCEMCGSTDLIKSDGVFVCQSCGCKYSVEEAKKMMVEGTVEIQGTVKIDDTDAVNEQVKIWLKMADDAFGNNNHQEAYTYYCKVLEKNVKSWYATYKKGLSIGWQANLNDMRATEVLGGVVDAVTLIYEDESLPDEKKAAEIVEIAGQVHNWIAAISNLTVNHGNEFANEVVSAAREFYQREQVISELIVFNLGLFSEFVYENYENKKYIKDLINIMCSLGNTTVSNMRATFNIKTDVKWNAFWERYDDVYEQVNPDYKTVSARDALNNKMAEIKNNLKIWRENFERKIAEKKAQELKEKREKYWQENPEQYSLYNNLVAEEKNARDLLSKAKQSLSDAEKELVPITDKHNTIQSVIDGKLSEIEKLQKKIFGKKKAQERISEIELEIQDEKNKIIALQPVENEINQKITNAKNILQNAEKVLNDVHSKVKKIEHTAEA